MPIKTLYVSGVRPRYVAHGVTRYEVFTKETPDGFWSEKYSTRDALKASLCDQAAKQGRTVTIGARDTVYGPEIVTVEL